MGRNTNTSHRRPQFSDSTQRREIESQSCSSSRIEPRFHVPKEAGSGLIRRMLKSSGSTLMASFTPINSFILKSNNIIPCSMFHRTSTRLRKPYAYTQNHQLHAKGDMVAGRYLPPLFSVAPMMDWTDNHYRTLARLISKHAWLYTEMRAVETIVYQKDNLDRFLEFGSEQHPIVLQIGGNNLENIAKATALAHPYGYDEINFNCGCPSPRVAGHGCFGVSLMLNPKFVGEAMSAIASNTDVPVSVKCRIGVDDHDSYNELCDFIDKVSSLSPTRHFIIHSRKALLNGISPAKNRTIPPLKYEYFYGLSRDFPDLKFTINGGINYIDEVTAGLRHGAQGVMVGRAAYHNPWHMLGHVDTVVYGAPSSGLTRRQLLEQYQVYGDSVLGKYGSGRPKVRDMVQHLLGLFHGEPGNNMWKRKADTALRESKTMKSFFEETLVVLPDSVLDAPIAESPPGCEDPFANVHSLLPPPYEAKQEELVYA